MAAKTVSDQYKTLSVHDIDPSEGTMANFGSADTSLLSCDNGFEI